MPEHRRARRGRRPGHGGPVATDGTIDFLCWPHLDSPTVFAALLDPDRGAFELTPILPDARPLQQHVPGTNVLLSRWLSEDGSAEVLELMPHPDTSGGLAGSLIRRVTATRGEVRVRMRCAPHFSV